MGCMITSFIHADRNVLNKTDPVCQLGASGFLPCVWARLRPSKRTWHVGDVMYGCIIALIISLFTTHVPIQNNPKARCVVMIHFVQGM